MSILQEATIHIREAILLGRTDILKKLLAEVRKSIEKENISDDDICLRQKYVEFVSADHSGRGTFLHDAVRRKKKDVARALLLEGSNPSIKAEDSNLNSLQEVEKKLSPKEVAEMTQVFVDIFFQATASSNITSLKQLVEAGLSLDNVDTQSTKNTPLHWAASFGSSPEVVKLFLVNGADPNYVNMDGATPLHEAAYQKNETICDILKEFGGDDTIIADKGKFCGKSPRDLLNPTLGLGTRILSNGTTAVDDEESVNAGTFSSESVGNGDKAEDDRLDLSSKMNGKGSSPIPPLITDERFNLLWPQPKNVHQLKGDPCWFSNHLSLSISSSSSHGIHEILDVWDHHRNFLLTVGRKVHLSYNTPRQSSSEEDKMVDIFCSVSPLFGIRGAYRLTVNSDVIKIFSSDLEGLHNAIATLIQLFRLFCNQPDEGRQEEMTAIMPVLISDHPDITMRAGLIDFNPYGRLPKMEVLFVIVDTLSLLKYNQLHAFFRIGKKDVSASSVLGYAESEIVTLDRHCRDRHITLVPSFDIDSASLKSGEELENARKIIKEILLYFDRPPIVHLGPAISALVAKSEANLEDFICGPNQPTTILFCANSFQDGDHHKIPMDAVATGYGFQATEHFSSTLSGFMEAGLNVGTCSGTCAWSSLAGSPNVAINNGYSAARTFERLGSSTLVAHVTAHWSSHPSLGHFVFAWPGFVIGACHCWNKSTPQSFVDSVVNDILDIHVLGEWLNTKATATPEAVGEDETNPPASVGQAILELGKAEEELNDKAKKGPQSLFVELLMNPEEVALDDLTADHFSHTLRRIKRAQNTLLKCEQPASILSESYRHEVLLTSELLILTGKLGRSLINSKDGKLENLMSTFRTDTANKLLGLTEQFRALWLSRYESRGLQGSLIVLSRLIQKLIPNSDMVNENSEAISKISHP